MASKNKMNKARNSYCFDALKWGLGRCKYLKFFDAAQRKRIKKWTVIEHDIETRGLDG